MSSNIRVGPADAQEQYEGLVMPHPSYTNPAISLNETEIEPVYCHSSRNGAFCKFGCQIASFGKDAILQIKNAHIDHCGQGGLNFALTFGSSSSSGQSYLIDSAITHSMHGAIKISKQSGLKVQGNFVYESLDESSLLIEKASGNQVLSNLIIGVMKISEGKAIFDTAMPAGVKDLSGGNEIKYHVVAGSDRIGYYVRGEVVILLPSSLNQTSLMPVLLD